MATRTLTSRHQDAIAAKNRLRRHVVLGIWALIWVVGLCTSTLRPASATPFVQNVQKHLNPTNEDEGLHPVLNRTSLDLGAVKSGHFLTTSAVAESNGKVLSLTEGLIPGANCTSPGILDFPSDLFTQDQRQSGAVIVHILASIYIFYAIAIVCDDYFVPSIERLCASADVPNDVAGASFMAIATSSPELFTNVVATFITEGDIGVGTVVGSAVFNILAVCACCGFAAKTALPLDWYPITRDCFVYLISVILLIVVLENRHIYWYEALVFVVVYLLYLLMMWKNSTMKMLTEKLVDSLRTSCGRASWKRAKSHEETAPLLRDRIRRVSTLEPVPEEDPVIPSASSKASDTLGVTTVAEARRLSLVDDSAGEYELFQLPHGQGWLGWTGWIFAWPARFVLAVTIPDCRRPKLRKLYPLTLIICIAYIGLSTYVINWMVTVIGFTLRIPDTVMGLTFLAAGSSIPEAVSCIIVTRQGLGSMSISNSIGSNTFDILICLGLPWLLRGIMIGRDEMNFVQINSGSLQYSVLLLLVSLVLFYTVLACNKFYLDKRVATAASGLYVIFLVIASMFELDVFFDVNLPTCDVSL